MPPSELLFQFEAAPWVKPSNILSITMIKLSLFRVLVISCFCPYTIISKKRCYSRPRSSFENDIGVEICIKRSWRHECMLNEIKLTAAIGRLLSAPSNVSYYFMRDNFAVLLG